MGYQVRCGILEARAYGIPKSRKRAFIPERPDPMHMFAGPRLNNRLSENSYYAAMKSTKGRASFRSLTVRDTIGDLPPVDNGASKTNLQVLTFMNMNPNPGSERKCKET